MRLAPLMLAFAAAAPAATVAGRVVERTNNGLAPVAGANLTIKSQRASLRGRGRPQAFTTGPDGAFVFADVAARGVELTVDHPSLLPADPLYQPDKPWILECTIATACTDLQIEMLPGAAVEGTLLDDVGDPVVSVPVFVALPSEERVPARRSARTDDRGHFRLFGLPWGEYELKVVPPRAPAGMAYTLAPLALALAPGEEQRGLNLSLELMQTFRVEGHVAGLDLSAGGAARLTATLAGPASLGARSSFARVDPDGEFRFDGLAAGEYMFSLQTGRRGRGPSPRDAGFTSLGLLDVRQDLFGLTLTRRPLSGLKLRARVVDGDDDPPPAAITVTSQRSGATRQVRADYGGDSTAINTMGGTYRVECQCRGAFLAGLEVDGKYQASTEVFVGEGEFREVTALLSQNVAHLHGRVRWPGGQPADNAIVGVRGRPETETVRANANGEFRIDGLAPGMYDIAAWAGDDLLAGRSAGAWDDARSRLVEVELAPGDLLEIDLTAPQ